MNHNPVSHHDMPLSEKVKSLPGFFGIHLEEEAPYDVLKIESGIEIRCYRPQTQLRMAFRGEFKMGHSEAFAALGAYLFGENKTKEKIKMTTPVLLEELKSNEEWVMTFILPPHFSLASAPVPEDQRITLHELPVHLIASISYPGLSNQEKIIENSTKLKKWIKKRPWFVPLSEFRTAQYDGPLTIPFFRKNEIHIEVKNLH